MANDLEVNAVGLRIAAAGSNYVAQELASTTSGSQTGARRSSVAVAALDRVIAAVRSRQSSRISGQVGDLFTSAARYDETDGDGASIVTVTM